MSWQKIINRSLITLIFFIPIVVHAEDIESMDGLKVQKSKIPNTRMQSFTARKDPLYLLNAQTGSKYKIEILINGHSFLKRYPPSNLFGGGAFNEFLHKGKNTIRVNYEAVDTKPGVFEYGPATFLVDVKRQPDWKDAESAQMLVSIDGKKLDPNGKFIEVDFQVQDNLSSNPYGTAPDMREIRISPWKHGLV